jgi:hypothetical protein
MQQFFLDQVIIDPAIRDMGLPTRWQMYNRVFTKSFAQIRMEYESVSLGAIIAVVCLPFTYLLVEYGFKSMPILVSAIVSFVFSLNLLVFFLAYEVSKDVDRKYQKKLHLDVIRLARGFNFLGVVSFSCPPREFEGKAFLFANTWTVGDLYDAINVYFLEADFNDPEEWGRLNAINEWLVPFGILLVVPKTKQPD